jgi:hypothetical protein
LKESIEPDTIHKYTNIPANIAIVSAYLFALLFSTSQCCFHICLIQVEYLSPRNRLMPKLQGQSKTIK